MTLTGKVSSNGERGVSASRATGTWRRKLVTCFVLLDALAAMLGVAIGSYARFGTEAAELAGQGVLISYGVLAPLYVLCWVAILDLGGTYDPRRIGSGPDEYRAVFHGSTRLFALVAVISYVGKLSLSRGFIAVSLVATLALSLLLRHLARKWVGRQREAGRFGDDLLIVGTRASVTNLVRHFRRSSEAGYFVLGAVVDDADTALDVDGSPVPVFGAPGDLEEILADTRADAVAIADPNTMRPGQLRELAWHLEGSGVNLLVVPAITDFAGPRVNVRPAAGLPLLHVEEPQLDGLTRLVKEAFDRVGATVGLLVATPIFVLIAIAIRVDSPGSIFFSQLRAGRAGRVFTVWKFRTMQENADELRAGLASLNELDGATFKIRDDPRMTRVGTWLRRASLDELPQLINVVRGEMSIVGPRPHPIHEVELYGDRDRRRLLVKPGLTGLWQVSGRAELSWDETVRLDLYYVENWSIALDMAILWRTAAAVIRGRGAY